MQNAFNAQASFNRRKIDEAAVSDREYEVIAKQVAKLFNVDWRWTEDRNNIEFITKK